MSPVADDGVAPHGFIESIGEACLVVDEQMMVAAANAAAGRLYARSVEDLKGYYIADLCGDCHGDVVVEAITTCGSDHSAKLAATQVRGDGSMFQADISARRCAECAHGLDHAGHSVLVVRERPPVPCCDDLELRSLLLDECIDAMIAHTLDGELLYANKEALCQWGFDSVDQIRARGAFGWATPEEHTMITERTVLLASAGELRFTTYGTRGNGAKTYCEVHARVIDTTSGPVVVAVMRDVSHRLHAEEMVRYLAYHDTLTGLANRTAFDEELGRVLVAAGRHEDHTGLVFIDVNDFKPINDTLGHTIGDHALQIIAKRINESVRLSDTVARMGGDEFVVLLPRLSRPEDLQEIARKIAREVSRPMHIGELEVAVTVSVGLALHEKGESAESFVIRADLAMYESRQTGVPGWELAWR